ncbi:TetR/AcrR family transcriptional regulator C-terminal domain-containing protein [Actinokineospora soli]|uniref:TetR/AcrR family transcriptional regulator C-terminal domain-containing protein n=1 Tax=Actinokineospora soli TaxID=1048753 RepID=A0ABW2TM48_9PSEU
MPRPRSLTPEAIAAAALAVIDREGLGALSMRAVAAQLGMGTMSLYRYVSDREQVERLVVAHILSDVDTAVEGDWRERVAVLLTRVRAAVAAHPGAVPLTLVHRHTSAGILGWAEAVLQALTDAGFRGAQRVSAMRALLAYLIGAVHNEHLGPLSGEGTARMAQLDDFPLTRETAADAASTEDEFGDGLRIVLDGLGSALRR